ncbi:molybdopterin molybdenumtransferase [Roseovarius sp. A-2]|uniref:molybdopterin molybdotransferase MoeA n=1 Tax=Roseovarius sp. A-2 TaxID=1570360 RepID=UPI0009B50FD2|nr:gephyrin-like molybdotransferase Glp [Roseovarius sp. A-2]GAW36670.1 molybdopterin molybdenumtransferase [Roseovarius sp. A-2]
MTIHRAIETAHCGCDGQDALKRLIGVEEALARVKTHTAPIEDAETLPLDRAIGRVLARPVLAGEMAPAFDNAAMDGYAIATSDLTGEGPWSLPVAARVPAGESAAALVRGTVARIFTGAPVPEGADAVVMQEEVARDGEAIQFLRRPVSGLNIRAAGSDMAEGAEVLAKGARLGDRAIAACAAAGADHVDVMRRLRVALLVTGDEVRQAGSLRTAAQIPDVNGPMLKAALRRADIELVATVLGADSRAGLTRQLGDLAERADLVITTGGISVGEEDHVKPAFAALQGQTLFSGVAIKPGKPVSVGRIGTTVWLGLPGNPLSAFVTWQVFGLALVRALTGAADTELARRHVITDAAIHRKAGRCEFRPATLAGFDVDGREVINFENATHSSRVARLSQTDGLMILPAEVAHLPKGARVLFQPFARI